MESAAEIEGEIMFGVVIAIVLGCLFLGLCSVRGIDREADAREISMLSDFELLTYREQIRELNELIAALETVEQMRTDLAILSPENVKVIQLEWQDSTGKDRIYEIWLDGENTAHESMCAIMEREACELRNEITWKTAVMKGGLK